MFKRCNHLRQIIILSIGVLLTCPLSAFAGWMGFRNETGQPIIVQETYANGRTARPQKLFANETFRDTPPVAGVQRKFTIYDANKPDSILATGSFPTPSPNENIMYVIKLDRRGAVTVEAVQTPISKK